MVLVRTTTMTRQICIAFVVAVLCACDPTWAINVDNRSSYEILVATTGEGPGGDPLTEIVVVPGSSRLTIGTNGVGSTFHIRRLEVIDAACRLLEGGDIGAVFAEGGTVIVAADLTVSVSPGGNPASGVTASTTDRCADAISQVSAPSQTAKT